MNLILQLSADTQKHCCQRGVLCKQGITILQQLEGVRTCFQKTITISQQQMHVGRDLKNVLRTMCITQLLHGTSKLLLLLLHPKHQKMLRRNVNGNQQKNVNRIVIPFPEKTVFSYIPHPPRIIKCTGPH